MLPGHGTPFRDGARRAETIAAGKRRRLTQVRELVEARARTVAELTADLFGAAQLTGAQRHFVTAEILAYLAYHEVAAGPATDETTGRGLPVVDGRATGGGPVSELADDVDAPSRRSGIGSWWSVADSAG